MRNTYLMGAALVALLPIAAQAQPKTVSKQVYQLHQKLITLDSHLDTPASLDLPDWSIDEEHGVHSDYTQVDLPRMKKGGLDGGFWAIYTGQGPLTIEGFRKARDFALLRGMSIRSMVAADPDNFTLALEAKDAAPIAAAGKRIVYMSIENAYPLGEDVSLIKTFYDMGVRVSGFAHFAHNQFADSSTDPSKKPRYGGLSPLGKELLKEMNRLGIVPDASHSSDQVLDDLLIDLVIFGQQDDCRVLMFGAGHGSDTPETHTHTESPVAVISYITSGTPYFIRLWQIRGRIVFIPG